MYKTDFVVRYYDIEMELLDKLQRRDQLKKEKEENEQKNKETASKKKRSKKASKQEATDTTNTTVDNIQEPVKAEEPKKRGRKKAIKEEPKKEEKNEEEDEEEVEYTKEDVHLICEKLYRDELLTIFKEGVEDVDACIKNVIEHIINNKTFKQLLEDIKLAVIDVDKFTGTPTEIETFTRNSEYLILITLFSQQIFHITHKCLCQLFTIGDLEMDLANKLKEKTISLFKK
jgi:hypothetical protein